MSSHGPRDGRASFHPNTFSIWCAFFSPMVFTQVVLFNTNVAIFALLSGVATGLRMQWSQAAINLLFLWVFGIPITYYLALVRNGGLAMVWTLINVPYVCMNTCLILLFVRSDWYKVQAKIQQREDMDALVTESVSGPGMEREVQGLLSRDGDTAVLGETYGSVNHGEKALV